MILSKLTQYCKTVATSTLAILERQTDRDRQRERDRQTETDRERQTDRQRQRAK